MTRSLFLFFLACSLFAQTSPNGSIAGRVLNSVTGAPIRKASVDLASTGHNATRLFAVTDAEGRFEFAELPPGRYSLSARHAGFFDRAYGANANVRFGPAIVLAAGDQVSGADIRLMPPGVIIGRVLDEDGDGASETMVKWFKQTYRDGKKQWTEVNGTPTNEKGEYRIANLQPGRYLVQAFGYPPSPNPRVSTRRDDPDKPQMLYVPAYYPNAPTRQAASPVEVAAGAEVRGIDIQLSRAPAFHVRGTVSGSVSGHPSVVLVTRDDTSSGGIANPEPPDGRFDMRGVVAGQYTIVVHDGYTTDPFAKQDLAVSGNVTGVALMIPPPFDLAGQVTVVDSGASIKMQDLSVRLFDLPVSNIPTPFAAAQADARGKLIFKSLSPGRYSLDVRGIPEKCYLQQVKAGGHEVSPDDLELAPGAALEIVLSATAGTITGSITDKDGNPAPYAAVTLIPSGADSRPMSQTVTDTFTFTRLKPGTYKLFAWEDPQDGIWQDPEFRKKYDDRATEVKIGSSETQKAQVKVIPAQEMK